MHLARIDWIIIAVYLAGCMTAGIWMRRFVRGVEDFAVAGRAMDLNLGIASLAATELGLVTVMYTAQLGFTHGFAGAAVGVLMATAMYLVGRTGFVIGPLRRAGVMTIPELFQKRFGTRVRWLAGLFVALGGILNMGIFLRLGGEFLVAATGMPVRWLEWVMTALLGMILLYTVLGGMLSVLVTDYLQFIVKGLGIVVTSVLVISKLGWHNLVTGQWLCWDGSMAGVGQTLHAHPFNPFRSFGWGYIAWQLIFQTSVVNTWQTQVSRVLSARDETTAKRMYRRTAFYFVGRFGLPGLWGVAALVYFSQHGGLPAELQALPADISSLRATPAYLGILLPTGFIGLLLAAALAAEMSTDSGYLLTWAAVTSGASIHHPRAGLDDRPFPPGLRPLVQDARQRLGLPGRDRQYLYRERVYAAGGGSLLAAGQRHGGQCRACPWSDRADHLSDRQREGPRSASY